jgi:hypothetical protein
MPNLFQRFWARQAQPRQIILLDPHGGKKTRRIRYTWVKVFLWVVTIFLSGGVTGYFLHQQKGPAVWLSQKVQLQNRDAESRKMLAEARATLALTEARLESTTAQLEEQRNLAAQLNQRLQLFESIMEARKTRGTRILRAKANWQKNGLINFNILLVKGGSYPRRVKGSVRLIAKNPDGSEQVLMLGEEEPELPYLMETHTFLHGSYQWEHTWLPESLLIIRLNRKGEEQDTMEIPIQGGSA